MRGLEQDLHCARKKAMLEIGGKKVLDAVGCCMHSRDFASMRVL